MQPTSDGAINIRPMGDDLVTTLCLHHGPLAAAQLRHSPDNGVDARLLHHPWPDSLLDELAVSYTHLTLPTISSVYLSVVDVSLKKKTHNTLIVALTSPHLV